MCVLGMSDTYLPSPTFFHICVMDRQTEVDNLHKPFSLWRNVLNCAEDLEKWFPELCESLALVNIFLLAGGLLASRKPQKLSYKGSRHCKLDNALGNTFTQS